MEPIILDDLKDKVALITGATGGLGSVIAGAFAHNRCRPAICYNENLSRAKEMQEDFANRCRVESLICRLDITDYNSCRQCVEDVVNRFGGIDIFINCAGQPYSTVQMDQFPVNEIRSVIDVHLTGVIYMLREIMGVFKNQKSGNIILTGSIAGQKGLRGGAAYSAAKAGLKGVVKTMLHECSLFGVRINIASPGFMDSGLIDNITGPMKARLFKEIPQRRFGSPQELADLMLYLASDRSGYITGQDVSLNGGAYPGG